jgi:hypothetical protein
MQSRESQRAQESRQRTEARNATDRTQRDRSGASSHTIRIDRSARAQGPRPRLTYGGGITIEPRGRDASAKLLASQISSSWCFSATSLTGSASCPSSLQPENLPSGDPKFGLSAGDDGLYPFLAEVSGPSSPAALGQQITLNNLGTGLMGAYAVYEARFRVFVLKRPLGQSSSGWPRRGWSGGLMAPTPRLRARKCPLLAHYVYARAPRWTQLYAAHL